MTDKGMITIFRVKRSYIAKAVALLTANCFFLSFVYGQAAAEALQVRRAGKRAESTATHFRIPAGLGSITQARFFGSDQVVINIQDLHCHPEVQRNTSRILSLLDQKYHFNAVYLEGAFSPADTSWLTRIKDDKLRNAIIGSLMKDGILTGAEHYSVVSGRPSIIQRLEDKDLYLANLGRLNTLLGSRKDIEDALKIIEFPLKLIKEAYCNSRQKKLYRIQSLHDAGNISTRKYYMLLQKLARRNGIETAAYVNIDRYIAADEQGKRQDPRRINNDIQELSRALRGILPYGDYQELMKVTGHFSDMDSLYPALSVMQARFKIDMVSRYPALARFMDCDRLGRSINVLGLAREEKKLFAELARRLASNSAEEEAAFLLGFMPCLRDFAGHKITADDYAFFAGQYARFRGLYAKYAGDKRLALLDPYFPLLNDFHAVNIRRNECFIRNIVGGLNNMNRAAASPLADESAQVLDSAGGGDNVKVVITGGFHTDGMARLLADRKISYVVVTPRVTEGTRTAEGIYARLIREQSAVLSHALKNPPITIIPGEPEKWLARAMLRIKDGMPDRDIIREINVVFAGCGWRSVLRDIDRSRNLLTFADEKGDIWRFSCGSGWKKETSSPRAFSTLIKFMTATFFGTVGSVALMAAYASGITLFSMFAVPFGGLCILMAVDFAFQYYLVELALLQSEMYFGETEEMKLFRVFSELKGITFVPGLKGSRYIAHYDDNKISINTGALYLLASGNLVIPRWLRKMPGAVRMMRSMPMVILQHEYRHSKARRQDRLFLLHVIWQEIVSLFPDFIIHGSFSLLDGDLAGSALAYDPLARRIESIERVDVSDKDAIRTMALDIMRTVVNLDPDHAELRTICSELAAGTDLRYDALAGFIEEFVAETANIKRTQANKKTISEAEVCLDFLKKRIQLTAEKVEYIKEMLKNLKFNAFIGPLALLAALLSMKISGRIDMPPIQWWHAAPGLADGVRDMAIAFIGMHMNSRMPEGDDRGSGNALERIRKFIRDEFQTEDAEAVARDIRELGWMSGSEEISQALDDIRTHCLFVPDRIIKKALDEVNFRRQVRGNARGPDKEIFDAYGFYSFLDAIQERKLPWSADVITREYALQDAAARKALISYCQMTDEVFPVMKSIMDMLLAAGVNDPDENIRSLAIVTLMRYVDEEKQVSADPGSEYFWIASPGEPALIMGALLRRVELSGMATKEGCRALAALIAMEGTTLAQGIGFDNLLMYLKDRLRNYGSALPEERAKAEKELVAAIELVTGAVTPDIGENGFDECFRIFRLLYLPSMSLPVVRAADRAIEKVSAISGALAQVTRKPALMSDVIGREETLNNFGAVIGRIKAIEGVEKERGLTLHEQIEYLEGLKLLFPVCRNNPVLKKFLDERGIIIALPASFWIQGRSDVSRLAVGNLRAEMCLVNLMRRFSELQRAPDDKDIQERCNTLLKQLEGKTFQGYIPEIQFILKEMNNRGISAVQPQIVRTLRVIGRSDMIPKQERASVTVPVIVLLTAASLVAEIGMIDPFFIGAFIAVAAAIAMLAYKKYDGDIRSFFRHLGPDRTHRIFFEMMRDGIKDDTVPLLYFSRGFEGINKSSIMDALMDGHEGGFRLRGDNSNAAGQPLILSDDNERRRYMFEAFYVLEKLDTARNEWINLCDGMLKSGDQLAAAMAIRKLGELGDARRIINAIPQRGVFWRELVKAEAYYQLQNLNVISDKDLQNIVRQRLLPVSPLVFSYSLEETYHLAELYGLFIDLAYAFSDIRRNPVEKELQNAAVMIRDRVNTFLGEHNTRAFSSMIGHSLAVLQMNAKIVFYFAPCCGFKTVVLPVNTSIRITLSGIALLSGVAALKGIMYLFPPDPFALSYGFGEMGIWGAIAGISVIPLAGALLPPPPGNSPFFKEKSPFKRENPRSQRALFAAA